MPFVDPAVKKAYDRKRRKDLRKKFRQFKESLQCEQCGESHPACLDFHHKDPKKKDFSLGNAIRARYSWDRVLEEIKKCIVLCSNCHRKLHYELDLGGT